MASGPHVVLHGPALLGNLDALRRRAAGACAVAAVLKANAYGHGLEPVARLLDGHVPLIAVSEAADAAVLAALGCSSEVLLLGPAEADEQVELLRSGVTVTIDAGERLDALLAAGPPAGARLHLLVDTGLRRLGVPCADVPGTLARAEAAGVTVTGAFLHPRGADAGDWEAVEAEVAALTAALGGRRLCRHHGGTSMALERPDLAGDLARAGIGLFGHHPHPRQVPLAELAPVLRLEATVLALKHVRAGEAFGYAGEAPAGRDMTLATLGIGVAHGLDPALAAGGSVRLAGGLCPFVGGPSLEYAQVDVTGVAAAPGDVATVIGGAPGCGTAPADVAARSGLIADHVLARISPRLTRTVRQ